MPTIWVGPVRSHCSPIRIVPFVGSAAFAARPSTLAVPTASHSIVRVACFMVVLPFLSSALIREWPYAKVIADVAPQPVKALRLDHQEEDDQGAEDDLPQIGDCVEQIAAREEQPAVILEKPAGHDGKEGA